VAWSTKSSSLLILELLNLKIAWRTIEASVGYEVCWYFAGEAAREDVALFHRRLG
jgi:hypothetical protein